MIDIIRWILEHAEILGWATICAALGGLLTPLYISRYNRNAELDSWIGGFIGLTVGLATKILGLLDGAPGWIVSFDMLFIVLFFYWFGVLPRTKDAPRVSNRFLRRTLLRYTFDNVLGQLFSHVVLFTWSLIVLIPIWTMLVNSLKDKREIYRSPFSWPNADIRTTEGFKNAWEQGNFDTYFVNSLTVLIVSLLLILLFGALAAYALAHWRSKAATLIYIFFIGGLMVPIRLGTINIVTIVQDLDLSGKLQSTGICKSSFLGDFGLEKLLNYGVCGKLPDLIPIYVAMSLPITIFVLTTFMRGIPRDLTDAARMDGASELLVFWRIMLPLTRPALATVTIFNMIPIWNDLWFPLILTRDERDRTVTYGVSLLFGQYQTDWNAILSTLSLAAIPVLILYLLMSKQFIKGLTAGAIKG